jgi:tubulin polyglutamylase TTLL4
MKPVAASCGRGIKVISKTTVITKKAGYLVSRYIARPHLINELKYDLRVYVLVTSFDPLKVYIYDDGLVRFATEKYSTNSKNLKKRFMHLTNFSVNKKSEDFVQNKNQEVINSVNL